MQPVGHYAAVGVLHLYQQTALHLPLQGHSARADELPRLPTIENAVCITCETENTHFMGAPTAQFSLDLAGIMQYWSFSTSSANFSVFCAVLFQFSSTVSQ